MQIRQIIVSIVLGIWLLVSGLTSNIIFAQETSSNPATIEFFWGQGCPHCKKQEEYLNSLAPKYPDLTINSYEVYNNQENQDLMLRKIAEFEIDRFAVPFTVIGSQHFVGFADAQTTGAQIEKAIQTEFGLTPIDIDLTQEKPEPQRITLPVFGQLDPEVASLPIVTIMIAFLDGFNPCAMWALIFLISLLIGMKDRKRMWILGTTFVVASGLVYFVFLAAWLNVLLFIGMVFWVRLGIGLLALFAGFTYLKNGLSKSDPACKVTANPSRRQIFEQLKALTQRKQFVIAFFGMIALAFGVNLIELFCSAGLPAVYTQILALNDLPIWKYYSYLVFYVIIFMLDDLIVFFTAMLTLKITGLETKYAKYSHIVGGVLMLLIGILMLFKPEWLSFS